MELLKDMLAEGAVWIASEHPVNIPTQVHPAADKTSPPTPDATGAVAASGVSAGNGNAALRGAAVRVERDETTVNELPDRRVGLECCTQIDGGDGAGGPLGVGSPAPLPGQGAQLLDGAIGGGGGGELLKPCPGCRVREVQAAEHMALIAELDLKVRALKVEVLRATHISSQIGRAVLPALFSIESRLAEQL
jgi:hypothetical protein